MTRTATVTRETAETRVSCTVDLDGTGRAAITTGIGMLDHLLGALARHSRIDVSLTCAGDLHVDDHHTAEDCAITLASALDTALGERRGIGRFGSAYAPLDEALVRAVIDLSGRPWAEVHLALRADKLGGLSSQNVSHVLRSLAIGLRAALHVDVVRAENDHHQAEAAFKAVALALRQAVATDGTTTVPSTKGVL